MIRYIVWAILTLTMGWIGFWAGLFVVWVFDLEDKERSGEIEVYVPPEESRRLK